MAFNPQLQTGTTPDYLGYSKGAGPSPSPNRAGEIFAQGLGNAIAGGAQLVDEQIQEDIYDDASAGVDQVRSLFGVDAATEASQINLDGPVPPDISRGQEYITRLNLAYRNGTIRESHYYGQLNNVVKGLKSRYPGYERQIDAVIADITGVTPANALVSALRREAEEEASAASNQANFERQYVKDNEAYIQRAFPNYFEDPSKFTFTQIQAGVARLKADESARADRRARMAEQEEQGKLDDASVLREAQTTANELTREAIGGAISAMGQDYSEISTTIRTIQERGTPATPEELEQLNNDAAALRSNLKNVLDQELLSPEFARLTMDQKNSIINSNLALVDNLIDAIHNEDYGLVAANALWIEATKNRGSRQILEGKGITDPSSLLAGREYFGESSYQWWLSTQGGLDVLNRMLGLDALLKIDNPQDNTPGITEQLTDLANTAGVQPELFKALIDNHRDRITGENPILAETSIIHLFEKENGLDITKFPESQRTAVFINLITPEVTAKVKELSASNPALWTNYTKWVYRTFIANTMVTANTTKDLLNSSNMQYVDVRLNMATGQIEVIPKTVEELVREMPEGQAPDLFSRDMILHQITGTFGPLNAALLALHPVLEADGREVGPTVQRLLQGLGVHIDDVVNDPESEEDQDTSDLLDNFILDATGNYVLTSYRQQDNPFREFEVTEDDGSVPEFLTAIGMGEASTYDTVFGNQENELLGDRRLTTMTIDEVLEFQRGRGTFPTGKYQIVRSTLQMLKRKLGLKGDEIYDEAMQDRLAMTLLEGRGYRDFLAGRITKNQFLDELDSEWDILNNDPALRSRVSSMLDNIPSQSAAHVDIDPSAYVTPVGARVSFDQVPSHGGSRFSRDFGGPRGGGRQLHTAVDIPGNIGDPVYAIDNGVVVDNYKSPSGYGYVLDIRYPDGTVHRMAHLRRKPDLEVGQSVSAGQQIAELGISGNASSNFAHVHYEVIKGDYYEREGRRPPGRLPNTEEGLAALRAGRYDPRSYFRQRARVTATARND